MAKDVCTYIFAYILVSIPLVRCKIRAECSLTLAAHGGFSNTKIVYVEASF